MRRLFAAMAITAASLALFEGPRRSSNRSAAAWTSYKQCSMRHRSIFLIRVRALNRNPFGRGWRVTKSLANWGGAEWGWFTRRRQAGLNRLVALKMILSGTYAGPQELARFRTEAESVARLQHPNIVQIYEIGEQDGRPFFSLEYVEGGSLDRKLTGTPLAGREAAPSRKFWRVRHARRPPTRYRSPRPEAGERSHCGLRIADCGFAGPTRCAIRNPQSAIRNQNHRLRPRQTARRGHWRDGNGSGVRHAELHGPRAGTG